MLINFTPLPLENVEPWGRPGDLSLSWFALTIGEYWIQVGESILFEYTEGSQLLCPGRYCEYQVARLHEDLTEMLPYILEPVPPSLVQYISGDSGEAFLKTKHLWSEKNFVSDRDPALRELADKYWETLDASTTWLGKRVLDGLYLTPTPYIMVWSDEVNVHFEWDNREAVADWTNNQPAFTALRGTYKLPRDEFKAEVRSFHSRLMEQMAERIDRVLSGALSAEIKIDLEGLAEQQKQRSRCPAELLDKSALAEPLTPTVQTDWNRVEKAINSILAEQNS